MDYRERVQLWSEKLAADDPLRVELIRLSENDAELQERFIAVFALTRKMFILSSVVSSMPASNFLQ